MPYQRDHGLGTLFSHHRFLDILSEPTRSEILREAEETRLNRSFTNQEWAAREPAVRAQWEREAQQIVAETGRLMQTFLAALPGRPGDPVPPWDTKHQQIVQDWLRVPRICMSALGTFPRSITKHLLVQVPSSDRKKYKKDLPALVVWWMIDSARQASRDHEITEMLSELSQRGASAKFVLLLSFVPTLVFQALSVRMALEADRRRFAPVIKRFQNPRTRLSHNDPWVSDLIRLRAAGDLLLKNATDQVIKRIICEASRRLPRAREQAIWCALGLDKTPRTKLTRQKIWDLLALPLLDYLEPFVPRTPKDDPRIIPDRLFWLGSKLLALRSSDLWEDVPDRLKSRWYRWRYG